MNSIFKIALASGMALSLAACGSSDDAATEAEADTVEIPAEEAVADINEMPVEDTAGTAVGTGAPAPGEPDAVTPAMREQATAEEAGANAADVAARVKAAQAATERATNKAENAMADLPPRPATPVPAN